VGSRRRNPSIVGQALQLIRVADDSAFAVDACAPSRYPRLMIQQAEPAPPPVSADDTAGETTVPPITVLLQRAASGDRSALDAIYASLYPELKRLARSRLHHQGRGDSVSTTMLVHESFERLINAHDLRLEDRRHFFAYAAKTMRNIIIDSARELLAERRGGGAEHLTLGHADAVQVADVQTSDELVRIGDALRQLEAVDPELAELVEMRYFGGYSETEIAALQGVTDRTVRRRWDKARAWLFVALGHA
jgi:RNA polymerase sigma factor (TIGR02999 family)